MFALDRFLSGESRVYPGGFAEFSKDNDPRNHDQLFKKLYTIDEVRTRVTNVIKLRLKTDKHSLMHF